MQNRGQPWLGVLPLEEEGRGHVRSLLWRCVDLVVRNITECAGLDTLPLDVQAAVLSLACRRRVCDRRLMRLFSPYLDIGPQLLQHAMGFALSGLKVLSRFAHVAALDLSGLRAHDCRRVGPLLARMRGLTSLNLRHYPHHLSHDDMKAIAGLPHLAELNLSRSRVEDAHVNLLSLPALTSLDISQCRGLRGDLWGLPKLQQLRELNISNMALLPLVMDHLQQLRSLEKLNCSLSAWLTDTSRLAGLTRLEELNVSHTPLGDEALEGLLSMTRLQRLTLRGAAATDAGFKEFLSNLQNLEMLDLSGGAVASSVKKLLDLGRFPRLRQFIAMRARQFTEAHLIAIKSAHPDVVALCNYSSFQYTVAQAFESPDAEHDPDLCARLLQLLRFRIYNGDTKDVDEGGRWRVGSSRRGPRPRSAGGTMALITGRIASAQAKHSRQHHKDRSYRTSGYQSDREDHEGCEMVDVGDRSSLGPRVVPYLDRLLRLMTVHFDHLELLNQGISLVRQLMWCCIDEASTVELYDELTDEKWINFMYRCLWTYPSDPVTVKNVLKAVPGMCFSGLGGVRSEMSSAAPHPRLVLTLMELMRIHAIDVPILSRCVDLVYHLSVAVNQCSPFGSAKKRAERYIDWALREGFVDSMACALAQHPHQPRVLQAVSLLAQLFVSSPFQERAQRELGKPKFMGQLVASLHSFTKSTATKDQPCVAHAQRALAKIICSTAPKWSMGQWTKPCAPGRLPRAKKLARNIAKILPTETKLDVNRNRRRRKKQAKQSREHAKEVVRRNVEKREHRRARQEARLKRMIRAEANAAKDEETRDLIYHAKDDLAEQWQRKQRAKLLRLKKENRQTERTLERRGGFRAGALRKERKGLRAMSSYEHAADIHVVALA